MTPERTRDTSDTKHLMAAGAAALEVVVGLAEVVEEGEEEVEEEEEEEEGVDGASPATVEIFTFIPWAQCPSVPHAKYLVPGLSSLTTSLPVLREFNGVPMLQFL